MQRNRDGAVGPEMEKACSASLVRVLRKEKVREESRQSVEVKA